MNNRVAVLVGDMGTIAAVPGWRIASAGDGVTADLWLVDADGYGSLPATNTAPIVAVAVDGTVAAMLDGCAGWILPGDAPEAIARVFEAAVTLPCGYQVRDLSDNTAAAIGALSADATRIAEALQALAARETPAELQPVTGTVVRRIIRLRRERDRFLPAMLFADPAWDMLLDLTVARLESVDVPVSSLCIAAAVPTTTALRWIRTLCEAGLFERYEDPTDARRSHIRLTERAAEAMLAWLRLFVAQTGRA